MKKLLSLLAFASALFMVSCSDDEPSTGSTDDGDDTPTGDNTVRVRGEITGTVNWVADSVYILESRVTVVSGATLNIAGGTVIKGERGQGAAATALLVARGGTLNASGTATAPIIFTSVLDDITSAQVASGDFTSPNLMPSEPGLWGGVLILGDAPISVNNAENEDIPGIGGRS